MANRGLIRTEIKETLVLGLPLITSQLIYSCSNFISTAMVARLGQDALAANVLVSTIWLTLSVMFFGILNAISILISHQFGADDNKAISEVMGQSIHLGIIVFILMQLALLGMPFILHLSSQPANVINLAIQYIHSLLWITPGLIALVTFEQFLTGTHHVRLVLRISFMIVPLEIPLIYGLIFGKFGLPACGIAGIGYGFAISYTLAAFGLFIYLYLSPQFRRFKIFRSILSTDLKWLKELFLLGLPMGLMHVIEVGTFTLATFWIAQFGTTMLAAHQIAMQYMGFIITIVFAMAQAVTIRVGYAIGKQDNTGIQLAIIIGMLLSFVCICSFAVAFYFIPEMFIRLDINIYHPGNSPLIQNAAALLTICGIAMIFDNFRIISFGALIGLKETQFPMYTSIVSFGVIGLTSAWLLGFYFHLDGKGVWWGLTIGIASGAVILLTRLRYLVKQLNAV